MQLYSICNNRLAKFESLRVTFGNLDSAILEMLIFFGQNEYYSYLCKILFQKSLQYGTLFERHFENI
ncbi:MAG: hypothetical protein H6Q14_1168 [Bacteroidetes bacterium]|nr:hypothetical protein [Bacteroidota bacterium]